MNYYEIAPNKIVRNNANHFTYSSEVKLAIGQIVSIPVGKKNMIGVVVKKTEKPSYEVKSINQIIEKNPIPNELLSLVVWISEYYCTHLATCLQLIIPAGIDKKRRVIKNRNNTSEIRERTKILLNTDQQDAVSKILDSNGKTVILHGITGSGKTKVYIESAKKTIDSGRSVVVLVPEISLTTQIVDEFSSEFKNVIVTHSKQTEATRHHQWKLALNSSEPVVVIGPRSALFMPLDNLGLIVVDEFHEPSYKQDQSPKYSTLAAASILAKNFNIPAVLGSATPNVADYFIAQKIKNPIIKMNKKAIQNHASTDVEIVKMSNRDHFTEHRFISNMLLNSIRSNLENKTQTLIFHNRRGSTPTTLCKKCGWIALCPESFIPLTLHIDQHKMISHITGKSWPIPTFCPLCKSPEIVHKGIGTKLIESELRNLFPKASIMRFDADTENGETLEKQYEKIYRGDVDIIIGTQVLAKGLDLPKLSTVGVIQADTGLMLPDFSASERTFQLLYQVVGRVGRGSATTNAVIQTYQPDHPAIVYGVAQNYQDFYDYAIKERSRSNFPPFSYLLQLTCTYKTEALAIKNAKITAKHLRRELQNTQATVQGPTPAFYERTNSGYRWQIILKSPKRQDLIDAIQLLPKNNHWQFNIDPVNLL